MTGPPPQQTAAPPAPRPLEAAGPAAGAHPESAGPAARDASPPDTRRRSPGGAFSAMMTARPAPRTADTPWSRTWQCVVGAAVTVLLAWLTYSRGGWIPILSAFDLGVHELGHLLTAWAPELLCQSAGSVFQVLLPLLFCAYFWWRRDQLAVIVTLAWAAENLHNVSVYIGDAQAMILPLFGDDGSGAGHDWHNILSTLGALGATEQLAQAVKAASVILFVVALGLAALGFSRARRG